MDLGYSWLADEVTVRRSWTVPQSPPNGSSRSSTAETPCTYSETSDSCLDEEMASSQTSWVGENGLVLPRKSRDSQSSSRDEYERWAYLLKRDSLPTSFDDFEGILGQLKWDSLDEPGLAMLAALNDPDCIDGPARNPSGCSRPRTEDWASFASTRTPPLLSFGSNASSRMFTSVWSNATGQASASVSYPDRQRKRDKARSFCRRVFQRQVEDSELPPRRRKRDAVKACIRRALPCILPAHEQDVEALA